MNKDDKFNKEGATTQVKQQAAETTDQVKSKATEVTNQVKEQTGQVVDQTKEQAVSMVDQRKVEAADRLGTVSQALHKTSEDLRSQDEAAFAQVAERAAEQVDRVTGYLRDKSANDMVHDLEDLSRRRPEVFLAGAFALGIVAARFLKSTRPESRNNGGNGRQYRSGYPQSSYAGAGRVERYGTSQSTAYARGGWEGS